MRKSVEKEKDVLGLGEFTKLYATYSLQEKEAKKAGERYKKMILDYAALNRELFNGKTLELPNGIRVELREALKAKWDVDSVSLEWLEKALNLDLGDAISVEIDPKIVFMGKELSDSQQELLDAIEYITEVKETMAVYAG